MRLNIGAGSHGEMHTRGDHGMCISVCPAFMLVAYCMLAYCTFNGRFTNFFAQLNSITSQERPWQRQLTS